MKFLVMPAIVLMGGLMLTACSPAPSAPVEATPPVVEPMPAPAPEPIPDPADAAPATMDESDSMDSSGDRVTPVAPTEELPMEDEDDAPHSSGDRV